jgi:ribosomal protein S18 acetylase RimI-like enzyme
MLRRYCEPTSYMVCAKVDNEVAGVAIWTPPKKKLRYVPLHLRFLRLVLSVYDTITAFIYPDWLRKMINPTKHEELAGRSERRSKIMDLDNEIRKNCVPSEMKEGTYWTLSVLGVSEEYGRRGIGTKLLQWGFDRADADDRPIFVSASQEGAALYKKSGFQVIHYAPQILYDPIRGWMDQTYLVRWNRSRREGL